MMSAIDLIASAPKRQSWLNIFVVVGAVGVAMLLILW
jgi:hypothetical protein